MKKKKILFSIMLCLTLLVGCETKNEDKLKEETNKENENISTKGNTAVVTNDLPEGVKAIFYLDPTDLSKECNAENSTSTTGTKSGCMKWYAYKETDDSYTMILDHNTIATVDSWSAASIQLATDTAGWIGEPRLITGQEIADITGNTEWTSTGNYFYLDTNSIEYTYEGKYYWLYDYTYNCTSYGCKVEDSSTYGYWTSTSRSSSGAWGVTCTGRLSYSRVSHTRYGVRPVITISKSSL